jgi:hypothetical protein
MGACQRTSPGSRLRFISKKGDTRGWKGQGQEKPVIVMVIAIVLELRAHLDYFNYY